MIQQTDGSHPHEKEWKAQSHFALKSVSFMENQCGWYGVAPDDEQ